MPILTTAFLVLAGAGAGMLVTGRRAARQCRKPSQRAGRAVLHRMNISHGDVTAWGLSHVTIAPSFTILDIGCGGGRTIERLASLATEGQVFGVDYSQDSVAVARETNRAAIDRGQVDIQLGSVSALPYAGATFDLVTAVETHYYWPDLPRDVREVMRVVQPGGTFLVIAETYRGRKHDWLYRPTMQWLFRAAYLTPNEHRRLLVDAGYRDVEVFVDEQHGWICARGSR